MNPKLSYSVQEAAEVVGCSARTLHALIADHELPAFTMSKNKAKAKRYIRHSDLVAYIDHCAESNAA